MARGRRTDPADGALAGWVVRQRPRRARPARGIAIVWRTECWCPIPASRAQADDVHDPSVVVDPRRYAWRNTAWRGRPWRETVLYELHAGILGGFRGVARELPRLAALGITAVELMPVNDFPGRRNWGYDGVLPYAPDAAYGTPDDLKALVDAAHDHGLMIFLDVVYNHFGPDGNYLSLYAPQFFREDRHTPWGPAIDFRRPEVRGFFTDNVLYWLMEYRFDGLRFDAVHAILDQDWVDEMAATVRATVEPGRHVHLVLEHHNDASHLGKDIDAQWNDDGHNVLHVLLTGEDGGYYLDYADQPAWKLARCLAEGFIYQGEQSRYTGEPRGMPSGHLPPTRLRAVPAEPRPDRQSRVRRAADRAGGTRRTRGGDRTDDAVPADPAAVHGRGERKPDAVPVLHRPPRGACRRGARGTSQRVREVSGIRRSRQPRTDSGSECAGDLRRLGAACGSRARAGA